MARDPVLTTERLELRPIAAADAAPLLELVNLESVRHYLLDGERMDAAWIASMIADSEMAFAERGLGLWAARVDPAAAPMGLVGYRFFHDPPIEELLYLLHPGAWGRGFATEMAEAAIDYAFSRAGRERVHASTDAPNEASLRVMRRLGMRETGREPAPAGSQWEQVHCALERTRWEQRRAARP